LTEEKLATNEEKADKKLLKDKINQGINKIKPEIIEILNKNNVKRAGIFGSYSRGEQRKNSDIDILIEPPKGLGFGFFRISIELEEKLGKKVDLITYNGINPLLRKRILAQEVRII
jgi:uncharacterized protein